MKPVALIKKLILDGSPKDGVILDLFGGSGSTLIASEKTKRNARLIEIEGFYVDIIVKRYIHFTGKSNDIFLIRDGQKYKFMDIEQDFMKEE